MACTTATATHEPTIAPIATPIAELVPPDFELDAITSEAFAELENLLKLGPRESATNQESAAAHYLQEKFQDLGYYTEIQEFTVFDLVLKGLGLTVNTSQQMEFVALPLLVGKRVWKAHSGGSRDA